MKPLASSPTPAQGVETCSSSQPPDGSSEENVNQTTHHGRQVLGPKTKGETRA